MFETSVIREQAVTAERRVGLISLSIAAHGFVILAVIAAGLHSLQLPTMPPNAMTLPTFSAPIAIPPAAGTPHAAPAQVKPAAAAPAARVQTAPPAATVTPSSIPNVVPNVPATSGNSDANAQSSSTIGDHGGPGGGEVGDPNGVLGGIPGAPPATNVSSVPADVIYNVGAEVKAPIVIRRVQPNYPQIAVQHGIAGVVVLHCIIDRTGHVRDVQVARSSFAPFEQAAVDAVRQWTFAPASMHGQSVDCYFDLTVTFTPMHR